MTSDNVLETFDNLQDRIDDLLNQVTLEDNRDIRKVLPDVSKIVADLLTQYVAALGKTIDADEDLLALFKSFVKGDPSLNAVRDNVREIVYYQNCLAENRQDALPKNPAKMAVRTVQHIYFYLRSRLEQERLLD